MTANHRGGDTTHALWYSEVRRDYRETWSIDIDMMDYCKICLHPLFFWEFTQKPDKATTISRALSRALARPVPVVLAVARDYEPEVTQFTDDVITDVSIWEPQDLVIHAKPTRQLRLFSREEYVQLVVGMRLKWACPKHGCQLYTVAPWRYHPQPTAITVEDDRSIVVHPNTAA